MYSNLFIWILVLYCRHLLAKRPIISWFQDQNKLGGNQQFKVSHTSFLSLTDGLADLTSRRSHHCVTTWYTAVLYDIIQSAGLKWNEMVLVLEITTWSQHRHPPASRATDVTKRNASHVVKFALIVAWRTQQLCFVDSALFEGHFPIAQRKLLINKNGFSSFLCAGHARNIARRRGTCG